MSRFPLQIYMRVKKKKQQKTKKESYEAYSY